MLNYKYTTTLLILILNLLFSSCSEAIEEYTSRDIVIVTLEINDVKKINKINFNGNETNISISKNDLINKKELKFKFPNSGEGVFNLCVENNIDTICVEGYVEGGYRPVLEFKGNEFKWKYFD